MLLRLCTGRRCALGNDTTRVPCPDRDHEHRSTSSSIRESSESFCVCIAWIWGLSTLVLLNTFGLLVFHDGLTLTIESYPRPSFNYCAASIISVYPWSATFPTTSVQPPTGLRRHRTSLPSTPPAQQVRLLEVQSVLLHLSSQ